MAKNEKTITDFKKLVAETKTKYLKEKMEHGLNYTFKEESLGDFEYFMICNGKKATKLNYSHEMKFIVNKEIIMHDVRELMEMSKDL